MTNNHQLSFNFDQIADINSVFSDHHIYYEFKIFTFKNLFASIQFRKEKKKIMDTEG